MLCVSRLIRLHQQPRASLTPRALWKLRIRTLSVSHVRTNLNDTSIRILQFFFSQNKTFSVHISTCSATHSCTHTLFWQRWPKCEMSRKGSVGVRKSLGPMMPQSCHPTSRRYVAPQTEIASVTCVLVPEILACCLCGYK